MSDGDWPPNIASIVHDDLPLEIREKFAESYETSFNGAYATIEPDKRDGVIAALEAAGYTVSEDPSIHELAMIGR